MVPVKEERQRQVQHFMDMTLPPPGTGSGMQPCPTLHLRAPRPQGDTREINILLTLGFFRGHFTQEYHHHFLVPAAPTILLARVKSKNQD